MVLTFDNGQSFPLTWGIKMTSTFCLLYWSLKHTSMCKVYKLFSERFVWEELLTWFVHFVCNAGLERSSTIIQLFPQTFFGKADLKLQSSLIYKLYHSALFFLIVFDVVEMRIMMTVGFYRCTHIWYIFTPHSILFNMVMTILMTTPDNTLQCTNYTK